MEKMATEIGYSLLIVFNSWAIGAILTQLIQHKPIYKTLSLSVYVKNDQWNRYLGVNFFKFLVSKSIYGKINRAIGIEGRTFEALKIAEQKMIKAEIGHLIGLAASQLTLIFIFILNSEGALMLIGTITNVALNLYPALLQQKNKRKIAKILQTYCR